LRLTVFTPDYTLVRVDANPVVGFSPVNQTRYVFPGQFLSVGRVIGQPNESRFHLASTTGEHLRSFGRILSQTEEHEGNTPGRVPLLAYFAGDTFWSVVETGMESAYVLEQWKLDGTLVQRLRRNADWWDNRERRRSILRVIRLHIDMEGRIWILMASTTDPENRTKLRFRYDVVSPRNGIVLASGSFPETRIDSDSLDYYPPILEFIQGTSRSWRPALDPETGIPSLQVFDLFLQGGY